ncbi:DUF1819 family protein [Raoultibacter massiliensis]|uniref:DUF1819 family protein n=1 Tax=Raoultibacter massiliensis TaxID=1852371 RepID=A0ABV1JEC0_9ACTN
MSSKYCLSLTGAGTYKQEMVTLARAYLESGSWDTVKSLILDDNILQLNTDSNRKRIGSELIKRLETLDPDELEFLAASSGDDLSAITWVTYCRTYPFMREFSEELIADRFSKMKPDVTKEVYQAFVEDKMYEHPELAKLTENSRDKVKIRVFGMARDCGLLDRKGTITPIYPSPAFVSLIKRTHAQELSVFPKVGALL